MRMVLGLTLSVHILTSASAAELAWGDVVVAYDPAVWRAYPPIDGRGLRLTCVAPDCEGNASLFGNVREMPPRDTAAAMPRCSAFMDNPDDWRRKLSLGEPAGAGIVFSAMSRWSGCRAVDAPILEACAVHGGMLYRFTTHFTSGCNFGPRLPEHHFRALLSSIWPSDAGR